MNYTLVTVAHDIDLPWVRLQAQSLERYLEPGLIDEIVLIYNSDARDLGAWDSVLPAYGALRPMVRLLHRRELAELPTYCSGWFGQQVLKLLASRIVETDRYLIIDAKNHLVHPLHREFVERGARMRSRRQSYAGHPMQPFLEATLAYFGLDAALLESFPPTVTPYAMPTALVRELVEYVETRDQLPFAEAFIDAGVSEFFLFAAYISTSGRAVEDYYDSSAVECPIVWEESADQGTAEVARLVDYSERSGLPFFAVHRRAVPKLDIAARRLLVDYWRRRGLMDPPSAVHPMQQTA